MWRLVRDRPDLPVEEAPDAPADLVGRRRTDVVGPWAVVLAVVGAGLVLVALDYWRRGVVLVGVAFLLAALLRVVLSTPRAGLLAVRFPVFDTVCYATLGLLIVVGAFVVPPPTPGG